MMNVEVTVTIECDANCATEFVYVSGDVTAAEDDLYGRAGDAAQAAGWFCSDEPVVDYCPRHRGSSDADHTAGH